MECRQHREAILEITERHFFLFGLLFLGMFLGHLGLSDHHGKYTFTHAFQFGTDGPIDWIFLQKVTLIPVLCGLAWRLRNASTPVLDYLGRVSFTIYFLHLYVIFSASYLIHWHFEEINFAGFVELLGASVAVPCLIASAVHWLLPRYSRALVGS